MSGPENLTGDEDDVTPEFAARQADMPWTPAEPDASTSPEALDVLRRQGAQAYEQYVAQQEAGTDDQA